MSHQTGILPALKDWGLVVVEVPGWQTRGSSTFDPKGHVLHHDVIPDQPGDSDHIPDIIIAGRSDLPGPLANFWLERDGDVHLCAAGRANHAGEGSWNGLDSNSEVWGTEMNNRGTPDDHWPEVQLDAMARLAACTAEFSGFSVANVCGHKEWAPTRKIDPHTISMAAFRRQVELQEKQGDPFMGAADDVIKAVNEAKASNIRQHQKDRAQQAALAKAEKRADAAEVDRIVKAIEAQDD